MLVFSFYLSFTITMKDQIEFKDIRVGDIVWVTGASDTRYLIKVKEFYGYTESETVPVYSAIVGVVMCEPDNPPSPYTPSYTGVRLIFDKDTSSFERAGSEEILAVLL